MRYVAALIVTALMGAPAMAAAPPAPQAPYALAPQFGFVAINVADLASSLHFYKDVLGLSQQFRNETPDGIELGLDFAGGYPGSRLLLNVNKKHQGAYPAGERLSRIALMVTSIDAIRHRMSPGGGEITQPVDLKAFKVKVAYAHDPDGNRIELIEPYPAAR